jgi:hypothetical protein
LRSSHWNKDEQDQDVERPEITTKLKEQIKASDRDHKLMFYILLTFNVLNFALTGFVLGSVCLLFRKILKAERASNLYSL